jgi:hypothetical protein
MKWSESYEYGDGAEHRFAFMLKDPVFASKYENINSHWDVASNGIKYDVKAMKKMSRKDEQPTDRIHFIELRNVHGLLGWVYGDAHYIAFETRSYWIVVKRTKLVHFVEQITDKQPFSDRPKPYQLYQRNGRKDIMTIVPTMDLLAISDTTIKIK